MQPPHHTTGVLSDPSVPPWLAPEKGKQARYWGVWFPDILHGKSVTYSGAFHRSLWYPFPVARNDMSVRVSAAIALYLLCHPQLPSPLLLPDLSHIQVQSLQRPQHLHILSVEGYIHNHQPGNQMRKENYIKRDREAHASLIWSQCCLRNAPCTQCVDLTG